MTPAEYYYDSSDDEWTCGDCRETTYDEDDMISHLHDAHWFCEPCKQLFTSESARREHWSNSGRHRHNWCALCEDLIRTYENLQEHNDRVHWRCRVCSTVFTVEWRRNEHETDSHLWCPTHRRSFRTQANYNAHMHSVEHVGRFQNCPFGCGHKLPDRSAIVQHLESGACASGVSRPTIDGFIQANDRNRFVITSAPQRLIEGPAPTTSYIASEKSWSEARRAYVCVLCGNDYSSLNALNAHLASPRHTYSSPTSPGGEKPYKCPNANCGRTFVTLSGVVQHAEFGSCGLLQMRGICRALDNVFSGGRLLLK
ncbi:hypothetical protein BMF94_3486 [Rhodotorula taiwanensis]|uniref:C2H2-type domain-containing protein n=1 Tax=Rhodotorula taiwanensis TaxID=741276 RepID=A0A2S5B9V1_9BASI|nr:hypothetical protein BMF94_3486 [Rhodotorula taiwanensis]